MPASRPSSPAAISSTDTVGNSVAHSVWLVDALSGGTIVDLKGDSSLAITNATYTTDGVVGKSLAGSGSGLQADTTFAGANAGIQGYPFAAGVIFSGSSNPANGGGEGLCFYIDSLNDSGAIYGRMYIDNNSGVIVTTWLALAGDSPPAILVSTGAYVPGALNAVCWRADNGNAGAISINGSISTVVGQAEGSNGFGGSNWFGQFSVMGGRTSTGGSTFLAAAYTNQALWWRGNGSPVTTNLTNAAMDAWTNDPWTILNGAAGGITGASSMTGAPAGLSSAGNLPITGRLTREMVARERRRNSLDNIVDRARRYFLPSLPCPAAS